MVALVLKDCLGTWQPAQSTVLIVDEPWGCAFKCLKAVKSQITIVLTRNPSTEYWEDLYSLRPNVLLAGEQSPESLCEAIKIAKPQRSLKLTPEYDYTLTPTEAKILRLLAFVKTNKQIASALNTEEQSIANQLSTIFAKLGVKNREEAMFKYWGMLELIRSLDE
jgi:DNA-binding NarL/FixJ family response regulator